MKIFSRLIPSLFVLLLTACIGKEDPPTEAPANVIVEAGESLVALDWDVIPGRIYWIYYKAGDSVDINNYDLLLYNKTPPYIVTGLLNDSQYAFSVTSSSADSGVGPFSAVDTSTPRLLSPAVAWHEGVSLSVNDLNSIVIGNGRYVAAGDSTTVFSGEFNYAEDTGVTAWEVPASFPVTVSANLSSVIFDGLRFVVLGEDGSIATSSDANDWVEATAITTAVAMNDLAVGAGVYVAVGDSGVIYTNNSDGVSDAWSQQTSVTGNDLYGVAFVNDRFIAVGQFGALISSLDGISWTLQTSNTSDALKQVAYGADIFVAVGDAGAIVSSIDGTSWSKQSLASTESFRDICFGPDEQFIAVGTNGVLAYSETGVDGTWTTSNAGSIDLNSIAPASVFIATGAAGANVSGK